MGSSLRTCEAIELGENENRRLHEIIEAGVSNGWHSFEQSLLKALEDDLITEQTAMAYSINKPTMRQRLDVAKGQLVHRPAKSAAPVRMVVVGAAEILPAPPMLPPTPIIKPEPRPGMLAGVLNSFM